MHPIEKFAHAMFQSSTHVSCYPMCTHNNVTHLPSSTMTVLHSYVFVSMGYHCVADDIQDKHIKKGSRNCELDSFNLLNPSLPSQAGCENMYNTVFCKL